MLVVEKNAKADLLQMRSAGGAAAQHAAVIVAFLQQLNADPNLYNKLLDPAYDDGTMGVTKFVSLWRSRDLWRLKLFADVVATVHDTDLSAAKRPIPYRIIYAYGLKPRRLHVLAIALRPPLGDFDYELTHPLTQRILADYDALGLEVRRVVSRPQHYRRH